MNISPNGKMLIFLSGDLLLYNIEKDEVIPGASYPGSYYANFLSNSNKVIVFYEDDIIIINFEYALEFPGWHDWDEGAGPYLKIFLTLYPEWTEGDFNNILIPGLQSRDYGWLRPEGVHAKLEEMSG
jgi:hypothetical protein